MDWYLKYVILIFIIYFAYWILETRIFNFFGLQKNVVYNGVKNDTLTGKAQGVRFVIMGILFFSFSIPALIYYRPYVLSVGLGTLFFISVWPISFVCSYWGCVILLRPHVFGEDSRCDIPCDDYAKDAMLNESIPLSYTELANRCISSFFFGTPFPFVLCLLNGFDWPLYPRIILFGVYIVILLAFTFMDKINEHWSYDIRYQPGYSYYMLCAYLVPMIPLFLSIFFIILAAQGFIPSTGV